MKRSYKPIFNAGPSVTGEKGFCAASVNKLGICWKEPCPGGPRKTQFLKPAEFDGKFPDAITRDSFPKTSGSRSGGSQKPSMKPPPRKSPTKPSSSKPSRTSSSDGRAEVTSLRVFDADRPGRTYADSRRGFAFKIVTSSGSARLAVLCDTKGSIKYVSFWVNGKHWRNDWDRPYSLTAGFDVRFGGKVLRRYTPWTISRGKTYQVACEAVGLNGSKQKKSVELKIQ